MTTSPIEWCGASTRRSGPMPLGPCVLRHGHDGPLHRDESGVSWTDPRPASESTEPLCPPALRERLVEAVRKAAHWCDGRCDCTEDDGHELFVSVLTLESYVEQVEGTPEAIADAVLPVVEARAAEQTQRAEQAEPCGDEHPLSGVRCTRPQCHDTHLARGDAWTRLADDTIDKWWGRAQRAERERDEVRATFQRLRDNLPKLERATRGIAATDSVAAIDELFACLRAALDQPEENPCP